MRRIIRVTLVLLAVLAGLSLAPVHGPVDPRPRLTRPDSPLAAALAAAAGGADLPALSGAPYYRIKADYDPDTRSLTGREEIWLTNDSGGTMYNLFLRSEADAMGPGDPGSNLTMTWVLVNGRPARYSMGKTLITIPLPEPIEPGETARVSFDLAIRLPDATLEGSAGVYGVGPYLTGLGGFPVIPASSPAHDRPAGGFGFTWTGALSLVEIHLALPPEWQVAGTGAREGDRIFGVTRGAPAVLIGRDLVTREQQVGDTRLRVLLPETRARYADTALAEAARGLAVQQELLGPGLQREVELLFAPLSGVEGLNLGGGLMLVTDELLSDVRLAAPATLEAPELEPLLEWDTPRQRQVVIYHELAHLWWSELVAPGAGGALELDEALAEATAFLTLERVAGPEAAERWWQRTALGYQVARLSGMPDLPLIHAEMEDEQQAFEIIYSKGALFFRRLRRQVGDQAYFAALRSTLAKHRLGRMEPEGPVAALPPGPELERLYRRWMLEERGDEEIGVLTVTAPAVRAYLGLDD